MSDLMFYGVLRMPYEMAMSDELSRRQFWSRAQEAADRVEAAEAELSRCAAQPADVGAGELPEMSELRRPAVTYADHSYPAYSKKQMTEFATAYARGAIAADRLAREAQQKPVAWLESEPSARGRQAHEVIFSVVYSSRIHTKCEPMTSNPVWPLYAAPPLSSEQQAEKGESNVG